MQMRGETGAFVIWESDICHKRGGGVWVVGDGGFAVRFFWFCIKEELLLR